MTEEESNLLKKLYLCDSSINTTDGLVEDAIMTLEHYFRLMNKDDLYERSRQLVIPYLALIAVRKDKTMSWISVKDRLPEHRAMYITCDELNIVEATMFDCNEDAVWNTGAGTKVTHWMQLPEPPEE